MPVSSLVPPAVGRLTDLALWEDELAGDPTTVKSVLVSRVRESRTGRSVADGTRWW